MLPGFGMRARCHALLSEFDRLTPTVTSVATGVGIWSPLRAGFRCSTQVEHKKTLDSSFSRPAALACAHTGAIATHGNAQCAHHNPRILEFFENIRCPQSRLAKPADDGDAKPGA